jgi:trimeric autotransporter adhesin
VMIGPTGRVDVSGLVATSANITNSDFMAGRHKFDQPGRADAKVVNEGQISVADGGIAALVAPSVRNAGQIDAKLGKVTLAAGNKFTLDLHGDRLVNIAISDAAAARLENSGQILADGGTVTLSAAAARDAVSDVVNTGVVRARSVGERNGVIVLDAGAGQTTVAGTLDASGRNAGETGGAVTVMGDRVALTETARIDVVGDSGGGTALVGGGVQGKDPGVRNASTVAMARGAKIDVSATRRGKGGNAVLWSENYTLFAGAIAAIGGAEGGNGGFVETSSKDNLQAFGAVDASAAAGNPGEWLLDPKDVELRLVATANGSFAGTTYTPDDTANTPAVANIVTIQNALNTGTSVTINTTSAFGGNGDITVVDAITRNANNTAATLTLNAVRNINVNNSITRAAGGNGALNLAFNAGNSINLNGNIDIMRNNGTATLVATTGAVTQSGGSLKANSLAVTAANSSSLNQAANNVNNLAARITAANQSFSYTDASGVAIGTVSGVTGLTTSGASGNATITAAGAISTVASNIGGNLSLSTTTGTITQSGVLTVGGASSFSTGGSTITLTQANQLSGAVSFSNSGNNDISLTNTGNTVLGTSNIGRSLTVTANSGGVTQTGALTSASTAATLTVNAADSSTLDLGNSFTTVVANITGADHDFTYRDTNNIVLGASTGTRNYTITSNAGNITQSANTLTVSGTATLTAAAGKVEKTGGNLTAGNLTTSARDTSAFNTSDVQGTLAATVTGAGQDFSLVDSNGLTLGAISIADGLTLTASTGNIAQAAGTVVAGGAMSLTATNGAVDQTGGTLQASSLAITARNSSTLNQAGNDVGTLTATINGTQQNLAYTDANNIALGAISVTGNLDVKSVAGDITQSTGTVTVGSAGTLSLTADQGAVTQTGGTLTSTGGTGKLAVRAQSASLPRATNSFATLAADTDGSFTYTDANAITIGTADGLSGLAAGGTATITTTQAATAFQNDAAINLGAGSLTVNSDAAVLNAGVTANGGIAFLPITGGRAINLVAGIAVDDTGLNFSNAELAQLSSTGLLTFGSTGGDGTITFNGASLAGKSVLARGGTINFSTAGSSFGNLTLTPGSARTVTVSVPVDLSASGGNFVQTRGTRFQNNAGGTISLGSGSLDVTANEAVIGDTITANGGIAFQPVAANRAINLVNNVANDAALNFSSAEMARLNSNGLLSFGSATTGVVTVTGASLGSRNVRVRGSSVTFTGASSSFNNLEAIANTGNVSHASGTLAITNIGQLTATAGAVSQGTGNITAESLGVSAQNSSSLLTLTNDLATLAASITGGAGQSFQYNDATALAVGTVGSLSGIAAGSLQVRTLSGNLTLDQPVSATAASGNSLVLAAGGNLINNVGPGALSTNGTARFLIYSGSPAGTLLGGITAPAKLYGTNRTFIGTPPASVPGTQSTLLYGIPAPTLIIDADDATREYGLANPAFGFTATGFVDGDTAASALAGMPSLTTAATIGSNVGNYAINAATGTLTSPFGYMLIFTGGTLSVTSAPLTVTAGDATREYGLANPVLTGSIAGLRNGDAESVVSGLTYGTAATIGSNVGNYAIASSGGAATNYIIATRNDGNLSVTPAALGVTANDATREYGLANPGFSGAVTGFRNGDTDAVVSGLTYASVAGVGSGVGSYDVTSSGGTATNYTITSRTNGTLAVTPAPLSVTADDKARGVGEANPPLTATLGGLRNGDSAAVLAGLTLSTPATIGSPVGSYAIASSGGTAANYVVVQRNDGTLTVAAAPPPVVTPPVVTPPVVTPPIVAPPIVAFPPAPPSDAGIAPAVQQLATDRTLVPAQTAAFGGGMPTPGDAAPLAGAGGGPVNPFSMGFSLAALGGIAPAAGLGDIAPAAGGDGEPPAETALPALGIDAFLGRWWEWRAAQEAEDEVR